MKDVLLRFFGELLIINKEIKEQYKRISNMLTYTIFKKYLINGGKEVGEIGGKFNKKMVVGSNS